MNIKKNTGNENTKLKYKNVWEYFEAIDLFFLEFADNPQASGVTLYANGRNQVAVTLNFRAKNKCGGYLSLTENDVLSVARLYHASSDTCLYSAKQKNTPWRAQYVADVFTQPASWLVSHKSFSDVKRDCDNIVRVTWYVSCSPWDTLAATSLNVGVTIAGKRYITDDYCVSGRHSHLLVDVLPQKKYVSSAEYENSDIVLTRYNTDTISVKKTDGGSISIDQDNYYLAFKNSGLYINKVDINSECQKGDLNATSYLPAKPFYTAQGTHSLIGFVWPLGIQQPVYCTLYSSLGDNTSSFRDIDPFKINVNEHKGQLCLTSLAGNDGNNVVDTVINYVYVTYYDQNGNSGSVILGPNNDDNGNTIKVLSWQDTFGSISQFYLQFDAAVNNNTVQIYANGNNQVAIRVTLEVEDTNGVVIPLTSDDVLNATHLCNYETGNKINWYGATAYNSDQWWYTGTKNDFCVAKSYSGTATPPNTFIKKQTINVDSTSGLAQCLYYFYSTSSDSNNSTDIAVGVTINGTEYSTAETNTNWSQNMSLHISVLAEVFYSYSGNGSSGGEDSNSNFTMTREDTATINNVDEYSLNNSDYYSGRTVDQDNYFVRLRDNNSQTINIVKVDINSPNGGDNMSYIAPDGWPAYNGTLPRSYYFNHSNDLGGALSTIIWPLAQKHDEKVVITYEFTSPENTAITASFSITVCQYDETVLCLTRLLLTNPYQSLPAHYGYFDCNVTAYDQYGNSGDISFPYKDSGNGIHIQNGSM
ncbi:hypothetical protein [Photorhabdus luminescens]|uniref:hypothetical protein n=1 Tax=Photorhabdus luminescens TaxID=29488 RepID=UPI00223FD2EB|nr:hypothetical protein [Photorhabdus luminescens]MCW7761389.1 hypothetical protein [Photorhabdus luminescens subsp. venezuelensis]